MNEITLSGASAVIALLVAGFLFIVAVFYVLALIFFMLLGHIRAVNRLNDTQWAILNLIDKLDDDDCEDPDASNLRIWLKELLDSTYKKKFGFVIYLKRLFEKEK